MSKPKLNQLALNNLVRQALAEDIGSGDATTLAVVPEDQELRAVIRAREDCVVAGLPAVEAVFTELDPRAVVILEVTDGDFCSGGAVLATVAGPARAILTGERTALNVLQRLSGIATLTRRYVEALADPRIRILDTRKTTPGMRDLEKYAVLCGGGHNHRQGLFDQVMIKDNHLFVASLTGPGGIGRAVAASRRKYPALDVEVEADNLEQVREALEANADIVLLDNMPPEEVREAVRLRESLNREALLEASGGIRLETIGQFRGTGVDCISCGAITHSAPSVDLGLDIDEGNAWYTGTAT